MSSGTTLLHVHLSMRDTYIRLFPLSGTWFPMSFLTMFVNFRWRMVGIPTEASWTDGERLDLWFQKLHPLSPENNATLSVNFKSYDC